MTIHPLYRGAALAALLTLAPVLRAADSNPTQDRADRFLMLVPPATIRPRHDDN